MKVRISRAEKARIRAEIKPGDRFDQLIVLRLFDERRCCPSDPNGFRTWPMAKVICDCGVTVDKVSVNHLIDGHTKSCGHARTTHGLTDDPLYAIHNGMIRRCYNPKCGRFADYGGRGLSVCKAWQKVEGFVAWNDSLLAEECYTPGLTLERRDNDKGYNPNNCYWATKKQQNHNRRDTIRVPFRGKLMPLADIYDHFFEQGKVPDGVSYHRVSLRFIKGWSAKDALFTAFDARKSHPKTPITVES